MPISRLLLAILGVPWLVTQPLTSALLSHGFSVSPLCACVSYLPLLARKTPVIGFRASLNPG